MAPQGRGRLCSRWMNVLPLMTHCQCNNDVQQMFHHEQFWLWTLKRRVKRWLLLQGLRTCFFYLFLTDQSMQVKFGKEILANFGQNPSKICLMKWNWRPLSLKSCHLEVSKDIMTTFKQNLTCIFLSVRVKFKEKKASPETLYHSTKVPLHGKK